MFFAEASEFEHWKNGENWITVWSVQNFSGIVGSWSAEVPSDGTYYFVMYNDAVVITIKASVLLKEIWWE